MLTDPFQPNYGLPCVFDPTDRGLLIEDVWPSLYIGADRVAEMARKVETLSWAQRALERMAAEAETVLVTPPQFVSHLDGEACNAASRSRMQSDAGHHLTFDSSSASPMWDPYLHVDVEPHNGAKRAWVTLQHERTRRLMSSLGFLYRLTGDERCSRWAWDGLRALGDFYEAYGRTYDQAARPFAYVYGGLYESQCQLQVVQALELLAGAPGGTAADIERVREVIVRPGSEAIYRWMQVMMVHNMSVWGRAAVSQAGRLLGEENWVTESIESPRNGLKALLTQGVPRHADTGVPDGFWFEHSPFYGCFYVITAITPLVRVAAAHGALSDDLRERYAATFDAMPVFADSRLRLLSISDRVHPGTMRLTQTCHLYEYAAGQVDAKHGALLAHLYEQCGASRGSLAALAFGPDELPASRVPVSLTASTNLPETQLVTFRADNDTGPATLWFQNLKRYPGSAQGHHHMDRLSISLHAGGDVLASDIGCPGCESPESLRDHYFTATFAHNTLLLNECDQSPPQEQTFEADLSAAVPWARGNFRGNWEDKLLKVFVDHHKGLLEEGVYEDAVISRTVWFAYPRVILLDTLDAESEKRFTFCFHARGQMRANALSMAGQGALDLPPLPDAGAWPLFTGRKKADPVELFLMDWRVRSDIYLRAVTGSDGAFEAQWGDTPDNPAEIRRGTMILRAPGTKRTFATVLEVHGGSPRAAGVRPTGDGSVAVTDYDGTESVFSAPQGWSAGGGGCHS